MTPIITVVSGTYNRLPLLKAMYASCRASVPIGIELDFVFVDGGSTDGTLEWLATQPDITTIQHGELLGAIRAFDDGAKAAKGKYVLLANDDIELRGDSLTRALIHLEETPLCGAVAFADNRMDRNKYQVWQIPVVRNGENTTAYYAQVGLFRRWLGNKVGWWRGNEATFDARTYAGDSMLSAKIWELGYTVDMVDGVAIEDLIYEDELRVINRGDPSKQQGGHPDSQAYYKIYPNGPTIPAAPTVENPDKKQLRIVYLPIYEQDRLPSGEYTPRCQYQHEQKHGLRDALMRKGALVYEVDYLAYARERERLLAGMLQVFDTFQPHMLLMQVQGADVVNAEFMATIRQHCPRLFVANWNGDVYPEALTNKAMLDMLRFVDLQLVVNAAVMPFYEQNHIPVAYWQCAYETHEGDLPDVPKWDVLFLGGNYSEYRTSFGNALLAMGINVGLYGLNWGEAGHPDCTYDFLKGRALYKNAKISIGDNQFPQQIGFVSNRVFEALAAGGALLLHQKVTDLDKYTGLQAGVHYIEWNTIEELQQHIRYWLDPAHEKERKKLVKAAQKYALEHHSFDTRVSQLFSELLPVAKKQIRQRVMLQYQGRADSAGGVPGREGRHYVHEAGKPLIVDALDVEHIKRMQPGLWQEMGAATNDSVAQAVERMR